MATATVKTSIFSYEGLDRNGKLKRGEISGTNPSFIKAELRKQGVIRVKKLAKKRKT